MRIILASGSPRRRELITKIYDKFEVITSDVDETIETEDPEELVQQLSKRKAEAVYKKITEENKDNAELSNQDFLVIGADTIVFYDGEVLGKPSDEEEATSMISMLSDRTHQVYTGVSVFAKKASKETLISFAEKTDVSFYNIDKFDIADYVKTGSPMDKAGAYGIQDDFAKHVKKIA